MQRRSATTSLMVDASRVLQETVGGLSGIEKSAAMLASGNVANIVALCRTRTTKFRSEFVSAPPGFVSNNKAIMTSDGQE